MTTDRFRALLLLLVEYVDQVGLYLLLSTFVGLAYVFASLLGVVALALVLSLGDLVVRRRRRSRESVS